MNQAVLQIPINASLRKQAVKTAAEQGFSSLQELIRVFLAKFAKNEVEFGFINPTIELSEKNDKRYTKMIDEYKAGKAKTKKFANVDDLMKELAS